jgi:predicted DNA-binding protein (UPF0251 family)/predicted Fe-Mo cluster-binding NifX family protein
MGPRRIKRYARRLDDHRRYKPQGVPARQLDVAVITLDEFEAMRLVDLENRSQIEAADAMRVSRATIQRLLQHGRETLVRAILEQQAFEVQNDTSDIRLKGETNMNIADKSIKTLAFPTSDRETVDAHFGHTKEFALYTIEGDRITQRFVTPPPHEVGVIPAFLHQEGVDLIITGGMGQRAISIFQRYDIDVILGAKGAIEQNLAEYLDGLLESQDNDCDHGREGHGHHGC